MFVSCQSDYGNQVHQLIVSVSKHFYIKKDGHIYYQKKALEIDLIRLDKSKINHVVHYLIRDHFSGTFYGEVSQSNNLIPVGEFLFNAWKQKEIYIFCGIPEFIVLPKTVEITFPGLDNLFQKYNIQKIKATSGFQAGIRDIRTWEDQIQFMMWRQDGWASFEELKENAPRISAYISSSYDENNSKIKKWRSSLDKVKVPPAKEDFIAAYGS